MKKQDFDEQIREEFSKEAGQITVPDNMREEIARRSRC